MSYFSVRLNIFKATNDATQSMNIQENTLASGSKATPRGGIDITQNFHTDTQGQTTYTAANVRTEITRGRKRKRNDSEEAPVLEGPRDNRIGDQDTVLQQKKTLDLKIVAEDVITLLIPVTLCMGVVVVTISSIASYSTKVKSW